MQNDYESKEEDSYYCAFCDLEFEYEHKLCNKCEECLYQNGSTNANKTCYNCVNKNIECKSEVENKKVHFCELENKYFDYVHVYCEICESCQSENNIHCQICNKCHHFIQDKYCFDCNYCFDHEHKQCIDCGKCLSTSGKKNTDINKCIGGCISLKKEIKLIKYEKEKNEREQEIEIRRREREIRYKKRIIEKNKYCIKLEGPIDSITPNYS